MQQWAIDLVTQMKPNVQVNKENDNLASSVIAHTLYWVKLFNEGAQRLCKIPVRANAAT
jgi:predicted DNA-binding ribbon-helix-helix protein